MSADARAQDAPADSAEPPSNLETIIVTGRAGGSQITQFEATSSISTFSEAAIQDAAPLTLADLFAEVPGVWAESSGGQSAANVFIRGIPAPGQFLFSKIHIDGLPVFEEHGIGFLTPDGLYRTDFTTSRLEAVRGGSAAVFASNAPGGIFNHISKRGSDVAEGGLQIEYGNFGHVRVDANYAGPINDKTTFAVGGFFRVSDGVRDPGFRADEGGQISANVTREFNRGSVTGSVRFIDERNLFLLPVPLDLDSSGNLTSITGFDANFDTLVSDDIRLATFLKPGGETEEFDLADGINNTAGTFDLEFDYDLGGGWRLVNKARYVNGETQFNSAIPFTFEDGNVFLADQLGVAQAAFGADVAEVVATFSDDGSLFELSVDGQGGNNGNGLIGTSGFFPVNSQFENFIENLEVSRAFDFLKGTHNVTGGFYASFYSIDQFQTFGTFVHEIDGSPRNLDLTAVDADGVALGTLTQNAFTSFSGDFFQNFSGDGQVLAWYFSDEWEVTDRLRLDGGFRFETQIIEGAVEIPGTFDLSDENSLLPDGALPTTADDAVVDGIGEFVPFRESFDQFSWSIAGNYEWSNTIATFARVSDGFRTPNLDDLAATTIGGGETGDVPVADILQAEGGVKIDLPYLRAFVAGFFSDVDDQPFTEPVTDATTGAVIDAVVVQSSRTIGVEVELDVGPFYGFSVSSKVTFQDPELTGLAVDGGGITVDDSFIIGNQVPRIPERIFSIRPRFDFNTADYGLPDIDGSVFLDIFNVGDRFQDFGNTILLPGFTTVGVGGRFVLPSGVEFAVTADNLTNTIGLTEGNPRTDLFAPVGAEVTVATFGRPIVGRNVRASIAYKF
ncbi:MAG: TonB-dependent siderophore receptor [Maricaulaceae bacterium]